MEAPQTRIIKAIIPTNETPSRYVVMGNPEDDTAHSLPSMEHTEYNGRTFEQVLSQIGHGAINQAISADKALVPEKQGEILYLAKAIAHDTQLNSGFVLSDQLPRQSN